jgi:hypothetical protein
LLIRALIFARDHIPLSAYSFVIVSIAAKSRLKFYKARGINLALLLTAASRGKQKRKVLCPRIENPLLVKLGAIQNSNTKQ